MSFKYVRKIPVFEELRRAMPLSEDLRKIKKERDDKIVDVIKGTSDRFLLVIGPCSAHNEDAVCEFVSKLARVQEDVKEKLVLVPRIYSNKPRTTGVGYMGMVHQPDLQKEPNMVEGLEAVRKMHLRALKQSHLTAADEMLYPENYPYLDDVLSYVVVGARSVENQQHRLTASGLNVPVGLKNPTSGDLVVMLNSIQAAQSPHVFAYNGWEVKTTGNPLAHAVLRGAVNQYRQNIPNYHYDDLMRLSDTYAEGSLENPAIIVDTNHANSNKVYFEQPGIAMEVMRSRERSKRLNDLVKGLMIESFLLEGAQDIRGREYGKSITDPCLGWESSERLVRELAEHV